jgi:CubicO group peptidase (beta-lactamase class C family)
MASLEGRLAISPSTRMRIGSITKHFTAALVLLLCQDGKLELDAPIRRIIPELIGPAGTPTIKELMLHRGGSRCHLDVGMICHGLTPSPVGTALKFHARQRDVNFQPGQAMLYNNGGYFLLAVAIERAAGVPYEKLLEQRLFHPLGMYDSQSVPTDYVITPGIATMHVEAEDGKWRRGLFVSEELRGGGGVVSTADDMLRWMRAMGSGNGPVDWDTLTVPPEGTQKTNEYYAFGVQVSNYRGLRTISHSGGVIGGSAQMITVPTHHLNVIVISNGAPACDPSDIAEKIIDTTLSEELSERLPPIAATSHRSMIGDWWDAKEGMIYNLRDDNGTLKLHAFDSSLGVDLTVTANGDICHADSGFRDLTFSTRQDKDDELVASFGGHTSKLLRLKPSSSPFLSCNSNIIGRYFSNDANAFAVISSECGQFRVTLSDEVGVSTSELRPLSDVIAYVGPFSGLISCALTFDVQEGRVCGFVLNSVRTRHLRFEKLSETL